VDELQDYLGLCEVYMQSSMNV